jgi:hypothetical protein
MLSEVAFRMNGNKLKSCLLPFSYLDMPRLYEPLSSCHTSPSNYLAGVRPAERGASTTHPPANYNGTRMSPNQPKQHTMSMI